jgi:hypothetical protein
VRVHDLFNAPINNNPHTLHVSEANIHHILQGSKLDSHRETLGRVDVSNGQVMGNVGWGGHSRQGSHVDGQSKNFFFSDKE